MSISQKLSYGPISIINGAILTSVSKASDCILHDILIPERPIYGFN